MSVCRSPQLCSLLTIRYNILTIKDKTDKDVKRCESVTSQINDASAQPHKRTIAWADVVIGKLN